MNLMINDNSSMTPAQREQWLEERRKGIGSSDAAAIIGLDPYKSPVQVLFDKWNAMPEKEMTEAMRFGIEAEQYVADRFTEATGKETITFVNSISANPAYPFALASIDRFIPAEQTFVEIKTTSAWNLGKFKDGKYPANYYVQCVHQMAVLDVPYCYLAVYIPGIEFKWFKIERDMEEEQALMQTEKAFWENYVVKKVVPKDLSHEKSFDAVKRAFFDEQEGSIQLVDSKEWLDKLLVLQAEKKRLEAEIDECKAHIAIEMQGYEKAYTDNGSVSFSVRSTKSLIKDKVLQKYPKILDDEEVWKESETRALLAKERKPKSD